MFEARDEIADNDELERQGVIQNIIFGHTPTTFLEKKAASIIRHSRIDFILSAKILQNLDAIVELYDNEEVRLYEYATKQAIRDYIEKLGPLHLTTDDILQLPCKSKILTLRPEPLRPLNYTFELDESHESNIIEFERLMFNNRVNFQYYTGTSFASYLYQNLLHVLNVQDPEVLVDSNDWRAKFLLLLYYTNFNEYIATNAFYQNKVTLVATGQVYDTSFVPKYDVKSLQPLVELQNRTDNEQSMINYYYTVKIEDITLVPDQFIGIFLVFPFKRGYYVQPNGRVVYPNVPQPKLRSTQLLIDRICDNSHIEEALDELARTIELSEVIGYALYADTLLKQGIALLILRRMTGNTIRIGGYHIALPTDTDILSWTRVSCTRHRLILPPYYKSRNAERSLALVQDIADMCVSEIGAVFICSAYRLLELDLHYVFKNLKSDAEQFVFYTLLLQEYQSPAVQRLRKNLQPKFGHNIYADIEYFTKNARPYVDNTIVDRVNSFSEPIVRPTDMRSDLNACPPYTCPELYRFTDEQLATLARIGDCELNREQLAAFIALCVQ
nr:GrBNV_gp76-like protein [Apis mellifera nudivirus]